MLNHWKHLRSKPQDLTTNAVVQPKSHTFNWVSCRRHHRSPLLFPHLLHPLIHMRRMAFCRAHNDEWVIYLPLICCCGQPSTGDTRQGVCRSSRWPPKVYWLVVNQWTTRTSRVALISVKQTCVYVCDYFLSSEMQRVVRSFCCRFTVSCRE